MKCTNKKQVHYYTAIRQKLIERLQAICENVDPMEPLVSKNPHHDAHEYINGAYRDWTLGELSEALSLSVRTAPTAPLSTSAADTHPYRSGRLQQQPGRYKRAEAHFDSDYAAQGRNCMLFESIRGLAYGYKSQCANESQLYSYVVEKAQTFNQTYNRLEPLSEKELEGIARSIAKWTWRKFVGRARDDCDRGAYRRIGVIDDNMDIKERKQVAGRRTAEIKAQRSLERVLEAREKALKAGRHVTIKGLTRELRMSRNTVRKYLREIESMSSETSPKSDAHQTTSGGSLRCLSEIPPGVCGNTADVQERPGVSADRNISYNCDTRRDKGKVPIDSEEDCNLPTINNCGTHKKGLTSSYCQSGGSAVNMGRYGYEDSGPPILGRNQVTGTNYRTLKGRFADTARSRKLVWDVKKMASCGSPIGELAVFAGVNVETIKGWLES